MGNQKIEFDKETIEIIKNIVKKEEIFEGLINKDYIIALKNVIEAIEKHGACDINEIISDHNYEHDLYFFHDLMRTINNTKKLENRTRQDIVAPNVFRYISYSQPCLLSEIEVNALEKTLSVIDPDRDYFYEYRNKYLFNRGYYQLSKEDGISFLDDENPFPDNNFKMGEAMVVGSCEFFEVDSYQFWNFKDSDFVPTDPQNKVVYYAYFTDEDEYSSMDDFFEYTNEYGIKDGTPTFRSYK